MTTPTIKPSARYSVDLVSRATGQLRDSVLRVFDYNRDSRAFDATSHAAGRCEIRTDVIGEESFRVFAIDGVDAMTVDDTGVVRAGDFTYKFSPRDYPRLEFIRRISQAREIVGSVTKLGKVSAFRFSEEPLAKTTDRFIFNSTPDWVASVFSLFRDLSVAYSPAIPPSLNLTPNPNPDITNVGGYNERYLITARVSGLAEITTYEDGFTEAGDNPLVYRSLLDGNGDPIASDIGVGGADNLWLNIASPPQRIFLNSGSPQLPVTAIDYEFTFFADSGTELELNYDTVNGGSSGLPYATIEFVSAFRVTNSLGPKGLLSQGFAATAAGIFETYRVLDEDLKRVLTPDGRYLTYPH